jgi:hypothetical protein
MAKLCDCDVSGAHGTASDLARMYPQSCDIVPMGTACIAVWQFRSGDQGSAETVQEIERTIFCVRMATSRWRGCVSHRFEPTRNEALFVHYGGYWWELRTITNFYKGPAKYEIKLASDDLLEQIPAPLPPAPPEPRKPVWMHGKKYMVPASAIVPLEGILTGLGAQP